MKIHRQALSSVGETILTIHCGSKIFLESWAGNEDLEPIERSGWLSIFSVIVKWHIRLLGCLRGAQKRPGEK